MIDDTEKALAGITPWDSSWGWPAERGENNFYELGLNYNSLPHERDTAIIVTSWPGHLLWLKATLTQYRLTGAYVICAYDNPYFAWDNSDPRMIFPRRDIWLLAHAWVFKHRTYDCDKRNGWFWDVRYAQGILRQFDNLKYIWTVNGDCIWEKPEGMREIYDILGDGDLMSDASDFDGINSGTIHTCSVVYKAEAFHKIFDNITKKFRIPTIGSRSPEVCLREAIVECELKEVKAPEQPYFPKGNPYEGHNDHYHSYGQNCTWKKVLGFMNLYAELETRRLDCLEPFPAKYFDFSEDGKFGHDLERQFLFPYYETGDRRYLFSYWSRSCDSWYNRLYYPIEAFGKEPIMEKHENEPIF